MSHDRCYEHKCRACSKCAETEPVDLVWTPAVDPRLMPAEKLAQIKANAKSDLLGMCSPEGARQCHLELLMIGHIEAQADENARLASEVARLNSYIANGVGGGRLEQKVRELAATWGDAWNGEDGRQPAMIGKREAAAALRSAIARTES